MKSWELIFLLQGYAFNQDRLQGQAIKALLDNKSCCDIDSPDRYPSCYRSFWGQEGMFAKVY